MDRGRHKVSSGDDGDDSSNDVKHPQHLPAPNGLSAHLHRATAVQDGRARLPGQPVSDKDDTMMMMVVVVVVVKMVQ